ncbi:YsnF/AvaK domain-containing protein [Devosia aurantiaca]|uniref:YsnF/AvaK domain-containing protein n=1 Tax=Devosia aurantiaca TaxID=2714858 RepID=A0A6M1SJ86_9HYPH|nr:YsnF/AvaK domain-containing protein [Devosia aurantiaca]NGP16884.1 YsnF/AvaK domain-containing protein [Devosia aurantiaca]
MSQYSATASTTLSAIFDSQHDAQRAVDRLIEAGISRDSISLMPGYESDTPVTERREQHQGFFSALADFFMPDEDRYSYAEGLSRGGYLVAVSNLPAAHYDVALDILDDEGSIDLNEREESWRSEGWTGYQAGTSEALGYGAGTTAGSTTAASTGSFGAAGSADYASDNTLSSRSDEDVIPVVDERLVVGKRDVNLGRVRVRSYIREEGVSENVNLHEERVNIERRPVDRRVSDADIAFQDRTIEAEEHAEQAVVGKEARVTEEIALRKDVSDRQETINDTVRKTEVEIEDDRDALDRQSINRR